MEQQWGWKPELGRWRLDKFGHPELPTPIAVSTNGVPRTSAYDYWRNVAFNDFEADVLPKGQVPGFQASARGLTCKKADFFETQSGAVSGGRTAANIERDGLDGLSIGLISRGRRWAEHDAGLQYTTGPGEFFAYDAAASGRIKWADHSASYLVIRREDAQETLGKNLPDPIALARQLASSPLRHLLADQLRVLSSHKDVLGTKEQAFLLGQAVQLALFVLARRSEGGQAMAEDKALFHTAMRYITANLADPMLETNRVAIAMGCSRATLYRAFAAQDLGVAETIRELRLDLARHLLENARPALTIAEVAMHCGIYDTANFSRQFKRRFGFVPSQVRPRGD